MATEHTVGRQESVTSFGLGFWANGVFKKVQEVDVETDVLW
jgi:hypothetical protein